MKKLNYQPNEVARSLSKQITNTIGVIVPHIRHPYFAELISYLENHAYLNERKILLFNSKDKDERGKEYLKMCSGNRVSGIILCSGNISLKDFDSFDIPMITIERYTENRTTAIECDNFLGGKLAAEHLIACVCQNIIHFNAIDETAMPADFRAAGFSEVCEKKKVIYKEHKSNIFQDESLDYHEEIEKVLIENPKADGIFASSDIIAAQILQVCHSLNIKVPSKMKIIGFDDVNVSRLTTPRITTIHQPMEEMARMAVEFLVSASKGHVIPSKTVLPVSLIKRETT